MHTYHVDMRSVGSEVTCMCVRLNSLENEALAERRNFLGSDGARWLGLATDRSTPPEMLSILAMHPDERVRLCVAENPQTSEDTLSVLANDPVLEIKLTVAEHSNTTWMTLIDLVTSDDCDIRYGLAENSILPLRLLRKLTNDDNPFVASRASHTISRIEQSNRLKKTQTSDSLINFNTFLKRPRTVATS